MKTIPRVPYVLSVFAAAAMLAGCGGSAQVPNATAQTPLSRERSDSSGNEVLTGKIHTHCKSRPSGLSSSCKIHTTHHGKATGPYRGTFTADGGYGDSLVGPFEGAYFDESFTDNFRVVSNYRIDILRTVCERIVPPKLVYEFSWQWDGRG